MYFEIELLIAAATSRSTTDVNSSINTTSSFDAEPINHAIRARSCSPFDNVWNGRNHDGTDANPIDDKMFAAFSGVVKSKFEINGLVGSNVCVLISPNVRSKVDLPVHEPP